MGSDESSRNESSRNDSLSMIILQKRFSFFEYLPRSERKNGALMSHHAMTHFQKVMKIDVISSIVFFERFDQDIRENNHVLGK